MTETNSVIGACVGVTGNLRGNGDVEIHGRVDGTIHLDATVTVAANGVVKAELHVRKLVVAGVVVGDIFANDCVELLPGSRVVGDIRAPRLIMAEGALFRGAVDLLGSALPAARDATSSAFSHQLGGRRARQPLLTAPPSPTPPTSTSSVPAVDVVEPAGLSAPPSLPPLDPLSRPPTAPPSARAATPDDSHATGPSPASREAPTSAQPATVIDLPLTPPQARPLPGRRAVVVKRR